MERKFCGGLQWASGGVPKEGDDDFCLRAHHCLPWVTMGHMSHHNLPYQNDPWHNEMEMREGNLFEKPAAHLERDALKLGDEVRRLMKSGKEFSVQEFKDL